MITDSDKVTETTIQIELYSNVIKLNGDVHQQDERLETNTVAPKAVAHENVLEKNGLKGLYRPIIKKIHFFRKALACQGDLLDIFTCTCMLPAIIC